MPAVAYETIGLETVEGIARLRLNRPAQLNAFTLKMHAEVAEALTELEADPGLRVLVITGEGRGFCAGQDLGERRRGPDDPPFDLSVGLRERWGPLVRRLAALPAPIVCGVNGVAAGAGANLAFACDIVIAARSAKFIQSFVSIGLAPDTAGTWFLPRLVGQARAMALALTAEPLPAETAADWGLIWKSVDDDRFTAELEGLAARLASLPPLALAGIKQAIRASSGATLDEQLARETDLQQRLGYSEDYAEGVNAFLAKRPPNYVGR